VNLLPDEAADVRQELSELAEGIVIPEWEAFPTVSNPFLQPFL
jgi:hypothetical protein